MPKNVDADSEVAALNSKLLPLINGIYDLKDDEGYDIAPIFQALPDRKITDYYKTIKRPYSLHMIKTNLKKNRYEHPNEFVKDLAQIVWNAKTYNLKNSDIYNYAQILEKYIKDKVLVSLHKDAKFKKYADAVSYPDLGPLPEDIPLRDAGAGSAVSAAADSNVNSSVHGSSGASAGSGAIASVSANASAIPLVNTANADFSRGSVLSPRHRGSKQMTPSNMTSNGELTYEAWCKRGRPPIIDRPYEHRIKNVMRMIKKLRNQNGQFIHTYFDKVPDAKDYQEYYQIISNPISLDMIRIKIRQRSYATVDQFLDDLRLMFNNAKTYNTQGSQIYNDTLFLEMKTEETVKEELSKPDSSFVSTDSGHAMRIPLDHLEVNGKVYKIGDWILVRNPNDPDKPIVAQLFRMWQTSDGQRYINVCWYYRPEQTVHRVDRLFYENEVCKSGQYRDHLADEIVGKCYVAYFTRYQRGDPGVQFEGPLFVCEYRYNDTDKGFNKIRTWKACLPDEVRHIEDPIIPLKSLRVMSKVESPLKHMLSPNASYDDPIPDPTLGHANAPPLIGAVYLRPPDPKDDLGQYSTSIQPNKNNIVKAINNVKNVTQVPLSQSDVSKMGFGSNKNSYSSSGTPAPMQIPSQMQMQMPIPNQMPQQLPSMNMAMGMGMGMGAENHMSNSTPMIKHTKPDLSNINLHNSGVSMPHVHHVNSSYNTMSTNFSYVLPHEMDKRLRKYSGILRKMDKQNAQKKLRLFGDAEVNENKHQQIIWMRSPPLNNSCKIQTSDLLTFGRIGKASRKRLVTREDEDEEVDKRTKKAKMKPALDEVHDQAGFGYTGNNALNHSAKYIEWRLNKAKTPPAPAS